MDLRGTPCPLNWVRTKLRLEDMGPGAVLEVIVDSGEPARNVSRSVEVEGHRLLRATPVQGGVVLVIERG
jgi:TusA-related sulfurtransferase